MSWTITLHFLLLLNYIVSYGHALSDEFILDKDRPYEVINLKVPEALWKQAFLKSKPIPLLKSPVTIVVPIHVAQDEDNLVEEVEEEVVTEENEVLNITVSNQDIVPDQVLTNTTALADATEQPIIQDEESGTGPQEVTGSVIRFPCSCVSGQCGCCTGAILERFSMKACGNISFVPEDFIFDVRLSVNNNTVVRRRVSASDPPPICFNPRRAPFVRVCAEISNIRIRNRNAFACLDINADIAGFPVYSASFRCFGLGTSGVQSGLKPKPASSGPTPVNLFGNNNDDDDDGGLIENAADAVLGGGDGLFGGGGDGLFGGGSNDDGPFDGIGDAVGDFFGDGRNLN